MTVTLNLDPELEPSVRAQAQERGVSVSDYLQDIISKQIGDRERKTVLRAKGLPLPALPLGAMGSLHRRDIYDDVR